MSNNIFKRNQKSKSEIFSTTRIYELMIILFIQSRKNHEKVGLFNFY